MLRDPSEADVAALARLLPQVSSSAPPLTAARLEAVLANPSTQVIVVRSGDRIIGMALLLICTTLSGEFGYVEEVAVDDAERGRHVSVHLMVGLLREAAAAGLRFVELTSRATRVEANGLYRKLGFELRETNCYRHRLASVPEPW